MSRISNKDREKQDQRVEEGSSTWIAEDAERLHHADHVVQTCQSSELLALKCEQAQGYKKTQR